MQLIGVERINTVAFETKRRKPLDMPKVKGVQGAAILVCCENI